MKATMITLAAIFTLFTNVLFAGNDFLNTIPAPTASTLTIILLAPVTPAEATFEDATLTPDLTGFYPAVPSEASFEEVVPNELSLSGLAPAIPSEAGFE